MQFIKSSFLAMAFLLSSNAIAMGFTSLECLDSAYRSELHHKGKLFGLIKNSLIVNKDKCLIKVEYKNILTTHWSIDVCRDPIHIKQEKNGSLDILKKDNSNCQKDQTEFCQSWAQLEETIQDNGLIFAEGEREILTTEHGKLYCAYLLLKTYLGGNKTFSRFDGVDINIIPGRPSPAVIAPEQTSIIENNTNVTK